MILFVLDACAAARIYFKDIGTKNMRQVYVYPQSLMLVPGIALCEVLSTLISAYNNRVINTAQYKAARAAFEGDLRAGKIRSLNTTPATINLAATLLCKHKIQPGKMGLGGADSLYLATASHLAAAVEEYDCRVVLITADKALYNAAQDESNVESFHFWTCDMGCDCGVEVIPIKGRPTSPNICPNCGRVCTECRHDLCPSTYQVTF